MDDIEGQQEVDMLREAVANFELVEGRVEDSDELREINENIAALNLKARGEDVVSMQRRAGADQILYDRLFTLNGDQIRIEDIANITAADISEAIVDERNEAIASDDDDLDPSQVMMISLTPAQVPLRPMRPIESVPRDVDLQVVITADDWRDVANHMPERLVACIIALSNVSDGRDRTWGDCAEFGEIVRLVEKLWNRSIPRGPTADAEGVEEDLVSLLSRLSTCDGATPTSVVVALKREHFLEQRTTVEACPSVCRASAEQQGKQCFLLSLWKRLSSSTY